MEVRRLNSLVWVIACLVGLVVCAAAPAKTVYVATTGNDNNDGLTSATPKKTVTGGYNAAAAGDTIQIASGTYYQSDGWVYVNGKDNLTFLGVGATRPVLDAGNSCLNSKGIFVYEIGTSNLMIENIEMKNARLNASGANAAGVRSQGTNLTLYNCYIHDCDDGVLNGTGDMLFEFCEFNHNGYGDGQSHNIYIASTADSFTMRYCYSHNAYVGHEVKTRALKNYIFYNRIGNEGGNGSYEVSACQGGTTYVIGNQIEQSPTTGNSTIIDYASEGALNPDSHLYVINNTVVNNYGGGNFVHNYATVPALLQDNIFQGGGTLCNGPATNTSYVSSNANLANISIYDYHLTSSSTNCINMGTVPSPSTGIDGTSLIPFLQYVHPCSFQARPNDGAIDIGAYEYGTASTATAVVVQQAWGQSDPTTSGPINFTATFSNPVTGFTASGVTLGGTAGATTAVVTGGPQVYNIAVSGMTAYGTIVVSIPAGAALDAGSNGNLASVSADNTVTYAPDTTPPTVTVEQASGQTDPTVGTTINFTATFSEPVTGFTTGDVTLSGTAGATTATVTGSGSVYNIAVTGMTTAGTVIASIPAGVAQDASGNYSLASTSTDNTVTFVLATPLTVTVEQAATQADPTNGTTINFTATFSANISSFPSSAVTIGGTAAATRARTSGSGKIWTIAISRMSKAGTVSASIAAGKVQDSVGNYNLASTSVDNVVTYDNVAPTVTVEQAAGQADPTASPIINFTATFSESVTGFTGSSVTLGGTAGATTAVVTGGPQVYNIAVSGMTADGTVTASIAASKVKDLAGNNNVASTSVDNIVTYGTTPIVSATASATTVYENALVTLHANVTGGAIDPMTYTWTQTAGQTVVASTGSTTADYLFTVPSLSSRAGGSMTFSVMVQNGLGVTASNTVNVQIYMAGDISHDWAVNVGDLQLLIAAWGSDNSGAWSNWNPNADLNGDGYVNVSDLQILVTNWGRSL